MKKKLILILITTAIAAFIFSNSAMSADTSSEESEFVLNVMKFAARLFSADLDLTQKIVRKLAHFTEFAVFGFFLSWTIREFAGSFKGEIFKILFILLCTPVIDETIQYFPVGRSAEVRDVLIDFCGAVTGFLIVASIFVILEARRTAKNKNN